MVRSHELECCHGVGHQLGIHGCDGCCGLIFGGLVKQTEDRIIKLLEQANSSKTHSVSGSCGLCQAIELIKGETK